MSRNSTQKISMHKDYLNNTINQGLHIYRTVCLTKEEYTFSSEHGTVSRIGYILCWKTISVNLKGLKQWKIYPLTAMESNCKSITEENSGNSEMFRN